MYRITLILLAFQVVAGISFAAEFEGKATWIYDGDTIEVANVGRVRLLGIDTPEYKASRRDEFYSDRYGIKPEKLRFISQKAKQYSIEKAKGERVRLLTEETERDRHGRLLAYLYLPDGTMLNRLLLKEGLATVFRRYNFERKQQFLKLEGSARREQRGLWIP